MAMTRVAISISLDTDLLESLDRLVAERLFPDRSQLVQEAIREKLDRLALSRLAQNDAGLGARAEPDLCEEGLTVDAGDWPEY
jgi:metal-responsive CopG/Arc/MetJ family transcriptional regulator